MATVLGHKQHKLRAQPLTVPDIVEVKLGMEEGDGLLFVEEEGRIFVQREARLPLEAIVGSLKTDRPFPTDEEIDAAVERAVADHHREKYDRIVAGDEQRHGSLDDIIGMFELPSPPSENFREERDAAWEQVARERVERMKQNSLPE